MGAVTVFAIMPRSGGNYTRPGPPQQATKSDVNEIADAVFRRLRESGVDMQTK